MYLQHTGHSKTFLKLALNKMQQWWCRQKAFR